MKLWAAYLIALPPSALLKFTENVSTLLKCWVIISVLLHPMSDRARLYRSHKHPSGLPKMHHNTSLTSDYDITTSWHYQNFAIFYLMCSDLHELPIMLLDWALQLKKVMWAAVTLLTQHPDTFLHRMMGNIWSRFTVAAPTLNILVLVETTVPASSLYEGWPCGLPSRPPPHEYAVWLTPRAHHSAMIVSSLPGVNIWLICQAMI